MKNLVVFTLIFVSTTVLLVQPVMSQSKIKNHDGWTFESQREAIAPKYWIEQQAENQSYQLILAGNGNAYINGHWMKQFPVKAGSYLRCMVSATYQNVEEPHRSLISNLIWFDKDGKQIGPKEFPRRDVEALEGRLELSQTYQVPLDVVYAVVTLVYRWDDDGKVAYAPAKLKEVSKMPERKVKLAAVHHKPGGSTSEQNLKTFGDLARKAGEMGADIVCLPEGVTLVGTGLDYVSVAESVPGPSTKYLGSIAKEQEMYIVAGILEMADDVVYNTAVLLDRNGKLAGTYRKVSLPREEIEGGVTPGQEFPVFETDFGKIGMMICWDVAFPEPARALAMNGAEVILMPIWGGNLTLGRARAIENQVYLVSSTYDDDMCTGVFDLEGEILQRGSDENPVVMVEVDLEEQKLWPWLGEFKNRIRQEMPSRISINKNSISQ